MAGLPAAKSPGRICWPTAKPTSSDSAWISSPEGSTPDFAGLDLARNLPRLLRFCRGEPVLRMLEAVNVQAQIEWAHEQGFCARESPIFPARFPFPLSAYPEPAHFRDGEVNERLPVGFDFCNLPCAVRADFRVRRHGHGQDSDHAHCKFFEPGDRRGHRRGPTDVNGAGNGTTSFTRSYVAGTTVTLTAPATATGGNTFSSWTGCTSASTVTCTVTLKSTRSLWPVCCARGDAHGHGDTARHECYDRAAIDGNGHRRRREWWSDTDGLDHADQWVLFLGCASVGAGRCDDLGGCRIACRGHGYADRGVCPDTASTGIYNSATGTGSVTVTSGSTGSGTVPAAPAGLTATAGDQQVALVWTASSRSDKLQREAEHDQWGTVYDSWFADDGELHRQGD